MIFDTIDDSLLDERLDAMKKWWKIWVENKNFGRSSLKMKLVKNENAETMRAELNSSLESSSLMTSLKVSHNFEEKRGDVLVRYDVKEDIVANLVLSCFELANFIKEIQMLLK